MTVLTIRRIGDPVLKQIAEPVEKIDKEIKKLIKDMIETMAEADGVGLAAPQVGRSVRLIVLDMGEGPFEIINPVVTEMEGEQVGPEGCLSVPDYYGDVKRFLKVTVEGLNRNGRKVKITGEELLARALQHEIDHLDGVLYVERASSLYRQEQEEE
jgi:peptide deformylase